MERMSWTRRPNKRGLLNVGKIKRALYKESACCHICLKPILRLARCQLDHEIPISVVGEFMSEKDVHIVCKPCHLKKTQMDAHIISMLKRLGVIEKEGYLWYSNFSQEERINLFFALRNIFFHVQKRKAEVERNE